MEKIGIQLIFTFETSKVINLNKYKLGYISTSATFEKFREQSTLLGFEVIGYINQDDFSIDGVLQTEMIRQFASKVDAVVIAQELSRSDIATSLVKHSKHLLFLTGVQSVLDISHQLENLLHEAGTVFQIGNLERSKPVFTSLRQYLKKPKFCRLERWTTSHLNIANQLIDDIDMAVSCFQSDVANVTCHTGTIFSENVDLINLKLSFQNGANADILLHAAGAESKSTGLFVAENGYYQVNFTENEILEIVHSNEEQLSLIEDMSGKQKLTKFNKRILAFNPITKAFQNFKENIDNSFTPLVNISDAKNIANVLQKAEQIMQRNCINWA